MFSKSLTIEKFDPELAAAIAAENQRQQDHVELIASENYVSPAVMEAQGSQLTNKYAEGYPGKRYYGGCEHVDVAEQLAIDRVKKLFGAAYANVQPHSGSQANQAVYTSVLKPGDTILGMSLAHGGHESSHFFCAFDALEGLPLWPRGFHAGRHIDGQRQPALAQFSNAIAHVCRRQSTTQDEVSGNVCWQA